MVLTLATTAVVSAQLAYETSCRLNEDRSKALLLLGKRSSQWFARNRSNGENVVAAGGGDFDRAFDMLIPSGMDFYLHLECFDTDDCRRVNLRWHNRTRNCFTVAHLQEMFLQVSPHSYIGARQLLSRSFRERSSRPTTSHPYRNLNSHEPCVKAWRVQLSDSAHQTKSAYQILMDYTVSYFRARELRYLFREIFEAGTYLFHTDRPRPLILDCGSNIGVSILVFKKLYPNSRIICFEADPMTFKRLKWNVEQNQLRDVSLKAVIERWFDRVLPRQACDRPA
jgi:hypothetical protein